jgi:murein DD-endopeptidase MepM/ murein hydrolase activator NlpD
MLFDAALFDAVFDGMPRRNRPRVATLAALLVLFVSLGCLLAVAPAPAAGFPIWLRPVPGRVARPFQAPVTRYGAGHLGVDLAAAPGAPVRAAGAGTVAFAGLVAGSRHVVVRHAGGLRTSYSFLASITVRVSEVVGRGVVLGTTGGRGEHHEGRVLHFGLRVGDTYVDPMQLFAPPDLSGVHLAPVPADDRPASTAEYPAEPRALRAVPAPGGAPAPVPPVGRLVLVASGRRTAAGGPLYPR